MKRVIVVGATGFFGRTAMQQLQLLGIATTPASRNGKTGFQLDANDPNSIRRNLSRGDLILDAAGPFKDRSPALIDAAIEIGFDLIDINEDLPYAEQVWARKDKIAKSGIRVLSSASTVSALAAAIVRYCDIPDPVRITSVLAPALRHTAHRGVALSMIRSLGEPIRAWRNGKFELITEQPKRHFEMPPPIGPVHARLFESADSLYLPLIWPSLQTIEMYVAARNPPMNALLDIAAKSRMLRHQFERFVGLGTWLARKFAPSTGGIAYEIESATGHTHRIALVAKNNSFLTAVAPAVLAAKAITKGNFLAAGLVLPDQYVLPTTLVHYLKNLNIEICEWE